MEALKSSLQVGALVPLSLPGGNSLTSNGRKAMASVGFSAKEVFYQGVSTHSAQISRRARNELKPCRVMARSPTEVEDARKADLQQERESKNFTITEVEQASPLDWHAATVAKVEDVALGVRCVTLLAECSREFVALEKAYRKPGQIAQVKVGETVSKTPAASAPFSDEINYQVLLKIRGDIPAGTTKLPAYSLSAKASLDLHVTETERPELYNVSEGAEVELGPFEPTGLDLRPIMFLSRYPTILLFAQGKGIAVARAILEAKDADTGSLNLGLRDNVRLYYSAPSPSDLAYKGLYEKWEQRKAVKVRTTVDVKGGEEWSGLVGSLTELWDEDDIEYDPLTTGVVVAVESDRMEEMKNLLGDSGIPDGQVVFWEAPN